MSTTYTTTTTQNKLVISYDANPTNPRDKNKLGIFITDDYEYVSIDKNLELEKALLLTSEISPNLDEWINLYQKEAQKVVDSPIIYISPISKYEHNGIKYSLNEKCVIGFVIVTQATLDNLGVKIEAIHRRLQLELLEYNQYINGEVYEYTLCNDDGEVTDSCSGFYEIDDMKNHLPQEYHNLDLKQFIQ